jgi:hypothetical protein
MKPYDADIAEESQHDLAAGVLKQTPQLFILIATFLGPIETELLAAA